MRVLVIAALLAAAGCDQIGGAKSEPSAAEQITAAPALGCNEGVYEVLAAGNFIGGAPSTEPRTALQQRAQSACQCLSAQLSPGDYEFIEGFASFQAGATREYREFEARIMQAESPAEEAQARAEVRRLNEALLRAVEQTGWRAAVQSLVAEGALDDSEVLENPGLTPFLRRALHLASLSPPILSEERLQDRVLSIREAQTNSCRIDFEQGFLDIY